MSTATCQNDFKRLGRSLALPRGPAAARGPGPVTRVPSLDEIERLTEVPDRRVVFRGVDWAFYDQLVDSIPESSNIHVDYDGRDLEVMGKGQKHDLLKKLLGRIVDVIAEEYEIPFAAYGEAIWKRLELARGLEADDAYYFRPEKLEAAALVSARDSQQPPTIPPPIWRLRSTFLGPQVDRAGIYAALQVAEVWRSTGRTVVIERLTAEGTYVPTDTSGFLPVRPMKSSAGWSTRLAKINRPGCGSCGPRSGRRRQTRRSGFPA